MADEVDIRKRLMTLAQPPMAQGSGGSNIEITEAELRGLRQLPDVDLVVLLSKINDRGWEAAKRTLAAMLPWLGSGKADAGSYADLLYFRAVSVWHSPG
jgi:hypothetical protein